MPVSLRERARQRRHPILIALIALIALAAGCERPATDVLQGYIEGEYVYVAAPIAGELVSLAVQRGASVQAGTLLFELESGAERAGRNLAVQRLGEGRARLEDARKGQRRPEIAALNARLKESRLALALSEKELVRQERIFSARATSAQILDQTRSARDRARQQVAQIAADLEAAHLGLRDDQIMAAESNVAALEAALARADWDLEQKTRTSPAAGLVFDTLYRQGEWVPAGRPVVALLPPANIKVRMFVPEWQIATVHPGDAIRVHIDGITAPVGGKVSFISPHAEYTPPVIYSEESRSKLVFMIEAVFDPAVAATLHPGQPVDVILSPAG